MNKCVLFSLFLCYIVAIIRCVTANGITLKMTHRITEQYLLLDRMNLHCFLYKVEIWIENLDLKEINSNNNKKNPKKVTIKPALYFTHDEMTKTRYKSWMLSTNQNDLCCCMAKIELYERMDIFSLSLSLSEIFIVFNFLRRNVCINFCEKKRNIVLIIFPTFFLVWKQSLYVRCLCNIFDTIVPTINRMKRTPKVDLRQNILILKSLATN